jgi:hypothetical protein
MAGNLRLATDLKAASQIKSLSLLMGVLPKCKSAEKEPDLASWSHKASSERVVRSLLRPGRALSAV